MSPAPASSTPPPPASPTTTPPARPSARHTFAPLAALRRHGLTGLALLLWVALVLALGLSLLVQPRAAAPAGCTAQVLAVQAAPSPAGSTARPTQGWVPVQLPDTWTRRWPQHTGSVWYRVDWQRLCAENLDTHENTPPEPIALGIDGLNQPADNFAQLFIKECQLCLALGIADALLDNLAGSLRSNAAKAGRFRFRRWCSSPR